MVITARCDYACRALLELTRHWPNKRPLQIKEIAEKQNIPRKYLVQILFHLKRIGLVKSIRGRQGGYILTSAPSKVKLGDVIRMLSGPLLPLTVSASDVNSVFRGIWQDIEAQIGELLDRITFEEISQRAKNVEQAIFYQI